MKHTFSNDLNCDSGYSGGRVFEDNTSDDDINVSVSLCHCTDFKNRGLKLYVISFKLVKVPQTYLTVKIYDMYNDAQEYDQVKSILASKEYTPMGKADKLLQISSDLVMGQMSFKDFFGMCKMFYMHGKEAGRTEYQKTIKTILGIENV